MIKLSGKPPVRIDGETLEPEIQLALSLLARLPQKSPDDQTPEESRAELKQRAGLVTGAVVQVGDVRDLTIDGADRPLAVRLYSPGEPGGPHPLLVYFHGGGWVAGDLDTHDNLCRMLCHHAGLHVLSVDYRLAPEHPFPAANDDGQAALGWALDNAARFDADPRRVCVGGDSAGATIATCVSLRGACGKGPRPAFQLLIYPVTDCHAEHRSYETFAEGFFLTRAQMKWYIRQYASESQYEDPDASPLLAPDLSGMPPALVVTAGFDVLRDEGEQYAQRMREASVVVSRRRFGGLIHGFVNAFGVSPASRDGLIETAGATRAMLETLGG